MKKFLFVAGAMLLASVGASAQFVNSSNSFNTSNSVNTISNAGLSDGFSSISISYSPGKIKAEWKAYGGKESEKFDMNSFSIMWNGAKSVSRTTPLYVGYGLGLQYSKCDDDYEMNALTAKMPLEVMYTYPIPNTNVCLAPEFGLDALIHIMAKDGDDDSYFDDDYYEDYKRFNLNWHIGAKVFFDNKFYLGLQYESPIVRFYDEDGAKLGISQTNISLGFVF